MLSRTSHVKYIQITNLLFSSNLQIGDTKYIDGATLILAEQHETTIVTQKKEQEITQLATFTPLPPLPIINEYFTLSTFNKKPAIYVDYIDVNSISAASILAVGNSDHIRMVSQVEDIRHLDARNKNDLKGE